MRISKLGYNFFYFYDIRYIAAEWFSLSMQTSPNSLKIFSSTNDIMNTKKLSGVNKDKDSPPFS